MQSIGTSIVSSGCQNIDITYWSKDIKSRLKEILIELYDWMDIDIIEGAIASDHVHMYCLVLPTYVPYQVMKVLKGKSAEYLRRDLTELKKRYWGLHIWACGYFVSTI